VNDVRTYRRRLPVSVERLYENALDWARLPHVHAASVATVSLVSSDVDGWRARIRAVGADADIDTTLRLDRATGCWIVRNALGEVRTQVVPIATRCTDIVVDVSSDGVDIERLTLLYDRDEAMMLERQRQLDTRIESRRAPAPLVVGRRDEIALPHTLMFNGRAWVIADVRGAWRVYSARCPHMLGPLNPSCLDDNEVQCPWHGYRFDVVTGKCTSGQHYALAPAPRVHIDEAGRIVITAS